MQIKCKRFCCDQAALAAKTDSESGSDDRDGRGDDDDDDDDDDNDDAQYRLDKSFERR
jgi:hypothetical protein